MMTNIYKDRIDTLEIAFSKNNIQKIRSENREYG